MSVATQLKSFLREQEMTIQALSEKSGISRNTLYAIIKRDNKTIKPEIARKIADALGISVSELLYGEVEAKAKGVVNFGSGASATAIPFSGDSERIRPLIDAACVSQISNARDGFGLSLSALSKKSGVPVELLDKIISGDTREVSTDELKRIGEALEAALYKVSIDMDFNKLNFSGKHEAAKRINELTHFSEYTEE